MANFLRLLASCSDYRPVEIWRIQCLHMIEHILQDKKHIQILHGSSSVSDQGTGYVVSTTKNNKNIFMLSIAQ